MRGSTVRCQYGAGGAGEQGGGEWKWWAAGQSAGKIEGLALRQRWQLTDGSCVRAAGSGLPARH